jgi:hypothetical protein
MRLPFIIDQIRRSQKTKTSNSDLVGLVTRGVHEIISQVGLNNEEMKRELMQNTTATIDTTTTTVTVTGKRINYATIVTVKADADSIPVSFRVIVAQDIPFQSDSLYCVFVPSTSTVQQHLDFSDAVEAGYTGTVLVSTMKNPLVIYEDMPMVSPNGDAVTIYFPNSLRWDENALIGATLSIWQNGYTANDYPIYASTWNGNQTLITISSTDFQAISGISMREFAATTIATKSCVPAFIFNIPLPEVYHNDLLNWCLDEVKGAEHRPIRSRGDRSFVMKPRF